MRNFLSGKHEWQTVAVLENDRQQSVTPMRHPFDEQLEEETKTTKRLLLLLSGDATGVAL